MESVKMNQAFQALRAALRGMRIAHQAKHSTAFAYASIDLGNREAIEVYMEDQLTGAEMFVVVRCDGDADAEWIANFPYANPKLVALFIASLRQLKAMKLKDLDAAIEGLREHADRASAEEAQRLDRVIGLLMVARKEKAK